MQMSENGRDMNQLFSYMMVEKTTTVLDTRLANLLTAMTFDGRTPNYNQQAVALSVAKFVDRRKKSASNRIMVSMPAGMGKSVVMGMLAALFEKDFRKIVLVYTDKDLRKFEEAMVQKVQEYMLNV